MATRDSITGDWGFQQAPRPIAPARLLAGGDLAALLDRRADVERTLDRVLGTDADFDYDSDLATVAIDHASVFGGHHG